MISTFLLVSSQLITLTLKKNNKLFEGSDKFRVLKDKRTVLYLPFFLSRPFNRMKVKDDFDTAAVYAVHLQANIFS